MTAVKASSNKDMNGLKVTNLGAPTAGSNDAARKVDVEAAQTAAVSRANHTGTQLANTISDFDTQVRTSRLDQMAAPTASINANSHEVINVLDPTTAQSAATRNYVDTALASLASGQTLKGTVRVAVPINITVAAPISTMDGVSVGVGDVVLLTAQSTGSQNGPWTYNGGGNAMTRPANWDSAAEAVVGSYWIVREGTNADKFALMTNDTFLYGTDAAAFTFVGMAATVTAPVEQDLGNGSATSFTITHNFGTRAVDVVIYRNASPWDDVDVYVERPTTNTIAIKPDAVWATNEFHAVVAKM